MRDKLYNRLLELRDLPEKAEPAQKQTPKESTGAPPKQGLPFTGREATKAHYRAAMFFHAKYSPPRAGDPSYWDDVCEEMTNLANENGNDPFLMGLLLTVWEELEREYNNIKNKTPSQLAGGR